MTLFHCARWQMATKAQISDRNLGFERSKAKRRRKPSSKLSCIEADEGKVEPERFSAHHGRLHLCLHNET